LIISAENSVKQSAKKHLRKKVQSDLIRSPMVFVTCVIQQSFAIPKQFKEHILRYFWNIRKTEAHFEDGKIVDLENCTLKLRALESQSDRLTTVVTSKEEMVDKSSQKLTKVHMRTTSAFEVNLSNTARASD
jgi:hypothetical protein